MRKVKRRDREAKVRAGRKGTSGGEEKKGNPRIGEEKEDGEGRARRARTRTPTGQHTRLACPTHSRSTDVFIGQLGGGLEFRENSNFRRSCFDVRVFGVSVKSTTAGLRCTIEPILSVRYDKL